MASPCCVKGPTSMIRSVSASDSMDPLQAPHRYINGITVLRQGPTSMTRSVSASDSVDPLQAPAPPLGQEASPPLTLWTLYKHRYVDGITVLRQRRGWPCLVIRHV
ncbi:hypothetical protein RRG08_057457 [Elysia crispata]|uniref:Uncharacterized protein n=1 Tax=Elysia crispata TaxID=231223 RepID=A0AAE0Z3L9_9GAST|nr:hypothetical protein RRG08_057457 [Elysia crispata]